MANPAAQALAVVRRRPMLAVAGAGVIGVIAYASSRGPSDDELAAAAAAEAGATPPTPGGVGVTPYALPGSYAPGDLATADLANAIREGNALNVNQLAQLGVALAPNPAAQQKAVSGAVQPILEQLKTISSKLPTGGSGPAKPPATPVKVKPTPAPPKPAPSPAPKRAPRPSAKWITYTVRPGDWLSKIAPRFGVPGGWQRLYADNRAVIGSNPNLIRPGQRLRVYATKGF